jgi:hypothetical protein
MYYLLLGSLVTFYLYYVEKKFKKIKYPYLVLLPVIYIYWIGLALQYDVGTDYFAYIDMYKVGTSNYIYNNNEYGFYYIMEFLRYMDFGEQSIFVVIGFIDTILLIYIILLYNKYGFKLWLFFLIFFLVSTIYHNQMNVLRQFVAILFVPIFFIYIYQKKYIKSFLLSILALSFHRSFLLVILLAPIVIVVNKLSDLKLFVMFLFLPLVFLLFSPLIMHNVVDLFFSSYTHYFGNININIISLLTKFYYIPILFYFWHIYLNKNFINNINKKLIHFLITIFTITYSMYLLDLFFPLHGRLFQYFNIFYIIPIYYVIEYNIKNKKYFIVSVLFLYILSPYYVKTVVIPSSEYKYESILFK